MDCNKINTLNFNKIKINYTVADGTYGFYGWIFSTSSQSPMGR
jgi:hypothetical protein